LSLLGLAMSSPRNNRARLAGTTAAVLGVTALDVLSSIEFTHVHRRTRRSWAVIGRGVPIEVTTIVNRSPEDCYRLWRDLEHIPRFMRRVESVAVESDRRSHWIARTPGGLRIEWDSEITHDAPGRIISWRSTSADVPNAGSVHFDPAPDDRGTLVRVRLMHEMPGGALGKVAAKLFGKVPAIQIREDLRRFKQLLEAGEIATTRSSA
ncbi:MAG: SRPBCC family protein, partial [Steroidobacteraceae bacterium]